MRKLTGIIVHHSASTGGTSNDIDQWHRDRGWKEVGYHFVITNGRHDPDSDYVEIYDGQIERGRSIAQQGAHWKGGNEYSIGVCLIGNGVYTQRQLDTLSRLLRHLSQTYSIPIDRIRGHYEVDAKKPECPMINMEHARRSIEHGGVIFQQGKKWREQKG